MRPPPRLVELADLPATLSVDEAARLLGISRALAYELARRDELPGMLRLGRRIRVSTAVVLNKLQAFRGVTEVAASSQDADPDGGEP